MKTTNVLFFLLNFVLVLFHFKIIILDNKIALEVQGSLNELDRQIIDKRDNVIMIIRYYQF